ncbi:MAG: bifunctional diaminohydroxyphosphoribosylaminopyrimidine deaminase/5-amino-6-(5-phosphoribosylamino)uracil reductase RibD, partial [Mariprofundaceae bacterium]
MAEEYSLSQDESMMRRALQLARRGIGTSHPNPRVGAVVVANGRIVGEGWHKSPGLPHAEALALQHAGDKADRATLYVTLEPCAGHGRTPPCTEAMLTAGIARIVFASSDPNPAMAGGGNILRANGLAVTGGILQQQADELNAPFFHYLESGRPLVIAKAAISLDGKLATHQLHSRWISNEISRRHAHRLRAAADSIIVGAGTLRHDNPSLTIRHARRRGEPPLRVVIGRGTPAFRTDYQLLSADAPARLYVNRHNE